TTISDTGSISLVAVSGESIRQGKDVSVLVNGSFKSGESLDSWERLEAEHDLSGLMGQTFLRNFPRMTSPQKLGHGILEFW
ncbi:hypothetical protein FRC02_007307, partial [Tulasnella sp. 418]